MFLMRKDKKGFTLVELLAVVVVLAIVLITILGIINVVFKDVDKTMDETTRNVILSAAENYALEYRGTKGKNGSKDWNEEVEIVNGKEQVSFCVSLKSLLDYGYFKDEETKFLDYKDSKAVYFEIKNGVTISKIVDMYDNEELNDECKYFIKNSSFVDGSKTSDAEVVKAGDGKTEIGNFKYKVDELGNNRYSAYLDFQLDMNPIFEQVRPINIVLILDSTGSMGNSDKEFVEGTAYDNAVIAMRKFTAEVVKEDSKLVGSQIALIEYGSTPVLRRGFENQKLVNAFKFENLGYTNVGAGIDMATSLIYTSFNYGNNNVGERENTYVILLFDGDPTSYSYCKYKEDDDKVVSLGTEGQTSNIKFNYLKNYLTNGIYKIPTNDQGDDRYINTYYKKYVNAKWCDKNGCPTSSTFYCDEITNTNISDYDDVTVSRAKAQTIEASKFLKSLGVKFITLGYNFDKNDADMKKISTLDNNLCIDVGNFYSYKENEDSYCYYTPKTNNVNSLFDGLLQNIIYYNNALEYADLIFEPVKFNGKDSIILYDKEGQPINGNVITERLNELRNLGENDAFDFLNNYTFEISDALYDKYCDNVEEGKSCEIESVKLFSVSVNLKYMSKTTVVSLGEIAVPKFNLVLEKNEKIN